MSNKYLFIDMNAFFASVEQQLRPELRNRPIAVVPVDADTTSCIAASYEAKKFGIKTGTRVIDAKWLCPAIKIVPARPKVYIEKHHQIIKGVDSVLPISSVLSVDEMVCRLWGDHAIETNSIKIAARVKEAIYREAGEYMRCSIGIAPNRLLSKIAADMKKPNGLTVIRKEDLPDRLIELKLNDFPGIGPRMERRFNLAGITTVKQLIAMTPRDLSRVFGSALLAGRWYHRLRGEDIPDSPTQRRSLGHSRVLEPIFRNQRDAREILIRLTHKAAARLRHIGYHTGSVQVSVSMLGKPRWSDGHRIEQCHDTLTLMRHVLSIWEHRPDGIPKKVGLVFGDLTNDRNVTRSLFDQEDRLGKLSKAMDEANDLFGRYAVYFGGMHGKGEVVNTRIAFGTVPDTELADC